MHLDGIPNFQSCPRKPFNPDRRDALSYLGGAAASKVGQASRLPSRKNSGKMDTGRARPTRDASIVITKQIHFFRYCRCLRYQPPALMSQRHARERGANSPSAISCSNECG